MNVLIIHTAYWTHYKASVHSEMQRQIEQQHLPITLLVTHLAESERSRAGLGAPDPALHRYPHEVLYRGFLEDFSLKNRLQTLFALVRRFRPDVINTPGYYDPAVVALTVYCKLRGIRVVMSIDSTEADHIRRGWRELLKRRIVGMADGFFCYGSRAADYMLGFGVRPDQILLRRNAVDNDAIRRNYECALPSRQARLAELGLPTYNLIYVGRLIDRLKNLTTLLSAFRTLKATLPEAIDWGLLLVGDGEDRASLEALMHDLPTVRFVSGQSWQQVPAYLALSDALVLPSYSEPWGLVVNEAMVCGLPVLVSDRCGCAPDLVEPGINGFIFDPYQPQELIDGLTKLMTSNPRERIQMGLASRVQIAQYSPESVANGMLAGFCHVVSPSPNMAISS